MTTNGLHRSHDNWRQTKIVGMPIARNVGMSISAAHHTVLAELRA